MKKNQSYYKLLSGHDRCVKYSSLVESSGYNEGSGPRECIILFNYVAPQQTHN